MERPSNIAMTTWLSLTYDQKPRQIMWCLHGSLLLELILPLPQLQLTWCITPAHPQALAQALARPEGERFISHVAPEYTAFPAWELSVGAVLMLCFMSQLCLPRWNTCSPIQLSKATGAASSGRRSSTPHTTFPHRGIRGADGITIWPTGVLLTVCEHTHPHTANILSTRSQQRRWVVPH